MLVKDHMSAAPVCANLRDGLHQTYIRMRERRIRHMPVLGSDGSLAGIITERDLLRPRFVDPSPNASGFFALDNSRTVEEAMTPDPVTITPGAPLAEALGLFVERRYGALPVVDDAGTLVGILSTIDVLAACQAAIG